MLKLGKKKMVLWYYTKLHQNPTVNLQSKEIVTIFEWIQCPSFVWDKVYFLYRGSYHAMFWIPNKNNTDNTLTFLVVLELCLHWAEDFSASCALPVRSWEGTQLAPVDQMDIPYHMASWFAIKAGENASWSNEEVISSFVEYCWSNEEVISQNLLWRQVGNLKARMTALCLRGFFNWQVWEKICNFSGLDPSSYLKNREIWVSLSL